MNYIKQKFKNITGYWIHKANSLPVGADLFLDIHEKIKYSNLVTVFDVGANVGQTFNWVRFNEPKAKIYSFEPVSSSFEILQKNYSNDALGVLEKLAMGEMDGEKTIRLFRDQTVLNSLKHELMNHEADAVTETISVTTLDAYCSINNIHKIDLLKIDTEGYEFNVLEGAANLLEKAAISFIYCEVGFMKQNVRNTYFADLTEWLAKKNYYFFGLYQMGNYDWKRGNYFGNALYVYRDIYNPL
ncbi:MAG: FkbM family methyltransferase [Ferruginibacter sp.]